MFKIQMQLQRIKKELVMKEEQSLKLTTDLDWTRNRIETLEVSLHQATRDIKNKTEINEK